MTTKTYTIDDVRAAIEQIDDMLRTIGFAANAGACQCTRCTHKAAATAPSEPADAPAPSPLSGGSLVDAPVPAPRGPRPGGIAVVLPHGMAKRAALAALSDEIGF